MATAHTSPKTPTARKSLPGSPSAISPNVTATGSPVSLQKLKSLALPLPGLTQAGNAGGIAPVAPMAAPKRKKVEGQVKVEEQSQHRQHLSVPASPLRNSNGLPHPANPLSNPRPILQPSMQPTQQPAQPSIPHNIFMATIQKNMSLYPVAPMTNPVDSRRIDRIAHGMWDIVFSREAMMTDVTMKAALFTPLKLRALARLNWLPSWWFLREMAITLMRQSGWLVDDSERQGEWTEAVEWCQKAETKCFGYGAAPQGGGLGAAQIQEFQEAAAKKVES
ncbi:hypothetical protein E8E12_008649 [Didymella heteroderae]|uniref:Uncharacterized protein n=1 Tax=Didymella heteroderae TaxID=1769908 RepID=A0A9P5C0P9_9PLEO|nr:hypothetical protein E8E12_008649 [Didymella heteroderae]